VIPTLWLCCTCKAAASAVPPAVIREHFDARDAIAWGADDGSRRTSPTARKWGFTNDLFLFTARQRDDLESDIMAKAAPLNMRNYNFVVTPTALCDLARTNGIGYYNSYFTQ
jgi:hypothetical protein